MKLNNPIQKPSTHKACANQPTLPTLNVPQSMDPQGCQGAREVALEIFASVNTLPDEALRHKIHSVSDQVYRALRELVLCDPPDSLAQTDLPQFLTVSGFRPHWVIKGWRRFFNDHEIRPNPPTFKERIEAVTKASITASCASYNEDRIRIRQVRRLLEDSGATGVSDSAVARMGLHCIPSDTAGLLAAYHALPRGIPGERHDITVIFKQQDRARIMRISRQIEDAEARSRVSTSVVIRIGIASLPESLPQLLDLFNNTATVFHSS